MTTSTPPRRRQASRRARPGEVAFFLAFLAIPLAMVAGALAAHGAWVYLPVTLGFAALLWLMLALRRWRGRQLRR